MKGLLVKSTRFFNILMFLIFKIMKKIIIIVVWKYVRKPEIQVAIHKCDFPVLLHANYKI